jgi:hypothetical protein
MMTRWRAWLLAIGAAASVGHAAEPVLRFGLVADVQYADKPTQGARRYAESKAKLAACVADLAQQELGFVVSLGDLIDGHGASSGDELRLMLAAFEPLTAPVHHVIGNHCLSVPRPALMQALGRLSGYYAFRDRGWRFIVLDAMDVSANGSAGPEEAALAKGYLARKPAPPAYNGAIGPAHMAWLRSQLAGAKRLGERVIGFCHMPTLAAASNPGLLLWNHAEVLAELEQAGCVAAWIAGHDHRGGYARRAGIHHLTLPGMVEAPADGNAYAVIELHPDRLVVQGRGTVTDASYPWPVRPTP